MYKFQVFIFISATLYLLSSADMHYIYKPLFKVDPLGAQKKVLEIGSRLGFDIIVSIAYEVIPENSGVGIYILLFSQIDNNFVTHMVRWPFLQIKITRNARKWNNMLLSVFIWTSRQCLRDRWSSSIQEQIHPICVVLTYGAELMY